ncbi:hypothetical protein BLNAU_13759 [Blattamonas nauphoetae]|uniref:Uncharacterized protein n=1 Tax=Blattamonas nauphoetae TaxID=2049346 RepID=A0ABQ9XIR5_9EUKA|nr:hypothetical protein BLNAU_13759 [Blattamonas nauphoetae]
MNFPDAFSRELNQSGREQDRFAQLNTDEDHTETKLTSLSLRSNKRTRVESKSTTSFSDGSFNVFDQQSSEDLKAEIRIHLENMKSQNPHDVVTALLQLSRCLSQGQPRSYAILLQCNGLIDLISLLESTDEPTILEPILSIMINVTGLQDKEDSSAVAYSGFLSQLERICALNSPILTYEILWALANLGGNSREINDFLLDNENIMNILHDSLLINSTPHIPSLFLLTNLCTLGKTMIPFQHFQRTVEIVCAYSDPQCYNAILQVRIIGREPLKDALTVIDKCLGKTSDDFTQFVIGSSLIHSLGVFLTLPMYLHSHEHVLTLVKHLSYIETPDNPTALCDLMHQHGVSKAVIVHFGSSIHDGSYRNMNEAQLCTRIIIISNMINDSNEATALFYEHGLIHLIATIIPSISVRSTAEIVYLLNNLSRKPLEIFQSFELNSSFISSILSTILSNRNLFSDTVPVALDTLLKFFSSIQLSVRTHAPNQSLTELPDELFYKQMEENNLFEIVRTNFLNSESASTKAAASAFLMYTDEWLKLRTENAS